MIKNLLALFVVILFPFWVNRMCAAPVVEGVNPTFGATAGGNIVTITGNGFTGATAVAFGLQPATTFIVNSDTSITAVAPPSGAPLTEVTGTVDITVTTPSGTSSIVRADSYTYQGVWFVYAADSSSDQIIPFNTATNTFGAPFSSMLANSGIAITPHGEQACITGSDLDSTNIINLVTNTVGTPTPLSLGHTHPAITPNGQKFYTPTPGVTSKVDVFTISNNFISSITVGFSPVSIAITPDGTKAYVCNSKTPDSTVSVLDMINNIAIGTIPMPFSAQAAAVTPDGTKAYIATGGAVIVIDVATDTIVGAPIPISNGIHAIAITPDGTTVYVANANEAEVTPIDVATQTAGTSISLGVLTPRSIVISPDSKTAYVGIESDESGIAIIDLVTTNITFVPSTATISNVAMSPDQAPVASFIPTISQAGTPSSFDASQSLSPVGTIVSYEWDFGDSTIVTTASPTIAHTYAVAGPYTVTLTVTNSAGTSTSQTFTGQEASNQGSPLATLSQNIHVPGNIPPPSPPAAVPQFTGKITRKEWGQSKKHFKLHCKWKKSASSDVVAYEIFAFNKQLKTISANSSLRFTKHLHSDLLCKRHVVKKYKKYLHRKYTIRAVSATGQKSAFTHLQVQHPKS